MRFTRSPGAAGEVRRFAHGWCVVHGRSAPLTSDVELIVSELVSNAVRHSVGPYSLDLYQNHGVLRGEVCDGSTTAPRVNSAPDESGGFGLSIVDACASRWGTNVTPTGKQIWFEINIGPQPDGDR